MSSIKLETTEMHTCGEPVRILTKGLPKVLGDTVFDKMNYVRDNLDHIRKLLMLEPRGHADMFGVMLVPPENSDAATGCVFIHNKGYAQMCGHATISLGRYLIENGLVKNPTSPETRILLHCPSGPVETFVEYNKGKAGRVRFNNVPAFLHDLDYEVDVPGFGYVSLDISFAAEYFFILPAARLGMDLEKTLLSELRDAADAVKKAVLKARTLEDPERPGKSINCNVLLTDGNDAFSPDATRTLSIIADKQVDRSPCGTGTTARIAQQFARGLIKLGQKRTFSGPTGGTLTAQVVKQVPFCNKNNAVVVEVSGQGYYTGSCTFTLEEADAIGKGFLVR